MGLERVVVGNWASSECLDLFECLPLDIKFGKGPKVMLPGRCSRHCEKGNYIFRFNIVIYLVLFSRDSNV